MSEVDNLTTQPRELGKLLDEFIMIIEYWKFIYLLLSHVFSCFISPYLSTVCDPVNFDLPFFFLKWLPIQHLSFFWVPYCSFFILCTMAT